MFRTLLPPRILPPSLAPARFAGRVLLLVTGLLLAAAPARQAEAGPPPWGKRHRDKVYKFSLPTFKDWQQVPIEVGEKIEVCKLSDGSGKGVNRDTIDASITVVRIPKGEKAEAAITPGEDGRMPSKEELREIYERMNMPKDAFEACCRTGYTDPDKQWSRKGAKDFDTKEEKVPGKFYTFVEAHPYYPQHKLFFSFATFEKDKVEYGLRMLCGEPFRKDYEKAFFAVAKGFVFFDDKAEDVESLNVLDGVNITAKRRSEIEKGMVRGWDVIVSPKKQYVVLYNTKRGENHALAKLIAERIERIREQLYEKQFPPAKPITAVAICRVCKDRLEYHAYGGPPGSAGYWNPMQEELVFYDASASKKADADTLAVLYHEAFHQYIHYSVGEFAPHSWFNEGHGDYYAGAKYQHGKFKIEPFQWRVSTVRNALVEGPRSRQEVVNEKDGTVERVVWGSSGYTPLQHLVAFSQREYYAYPSVSYAQGWSLIYFLREIVPQNKKYAAKWGKILDTYFDVLKAAVNAPPPGATKEKEPPPVDPSSPGKGDAPTPDPEPGEPEPMPPLEPPDEPPPPGDPEPGDPDPTEPPPAESLEAPMTDFRWEGGESALKKALDEAFKGIDWEEFEEAWKKATKSGK